MGAYTPDLEAPQPVVKPAESEKVFDKERLTYLQVMSKEIGDKISVRIQFQNYRVLEDGTKEDAPTSGQMIYIDDLVAKATEIDKVADTVSAMTTVEALAQLLRG